MVGIVRLEKASKVAANLLRTLAPACHRIEIAGSIRRGKPEVKDVELVAIPKGLRVDLFGEPMVDDRTELDVIVAGLLEDGLLEMRTPVRMGRRYQSLRTVRTGLKPIRNAANCRCCGFGRWFGLVFQDERKPNSPRPGERVLRRPDAIGSGG